MSAKTGRVHGAAGAGSGSKRSGYFINREFNATAPNNGLAYISGPGLNRLNRICLGRPPLITRRQPFFNRFQRQPFPFCNLAIARAATHADASLDLFVLTKITLPTHYTRSFRLEFYGFPSRESPPRPTRRPYSPSSLRPSLFVFYHSCFLTFSPTRTRTSL